MNDADWVTKHDVHKQKIYLVSKSNRGISFSVLKISVVYKNKYHGCYFKDILLVER